MNKTKTKIKINNLHKKVRHLKKKYSSKDINKIIKDNKTRIKKMNNNRNNYNNKNKTNLNGGGKTCICIDYDVKDTVFVNYKDGKKCSRPVKEGTDFCDKHQDCGKLVSSFLNTYELPYEPELWNNNSDLKNSHNCYTYFLNNHIRPVSDKCNQYTKKNQQSRCGKLKPQPGDFSELLKNGTLQYKEREYTCPTMIKKVKSDNPSIAEAKFYEKCPPGSYKGALVVDPGNTYHFYRQNKDGSWSHKPGVLDVIDKDASEKKIYFPHLADRNYKKKDSDGINYTDFCSYLCVPTKTSKVKLFSI